MNTLATISSQKLAVAAICLFATASVTVGGEAKKKATSKQENPDALLSSAMNNMNTGVWSVNGTVTVTKVIKLHGLLAGEDFDLSIDPESRSEIHRALC